MHNTQKGFLLYKDQGKQVELLSDAQAGMLIKALYRFASGEELPAMEDGMTKMCFAFIASQIERDAEAYDQKCKQMSDNARKGAKANSGNCKQKQANATNCGQLQANEGNTDTDTDTDTDTKTNTVTDTGTDTGTDTETDPSSVPSPAPQVAPQSPAPRLTEEERERLLAKGLPDRYVDERVERASEYAARNGGDVYDVLMEWWKTDRQRAPWNASQSEYGRAAGACFDSFDTDDFFQAALRKSFAMP